MPDDLYQRDALAWAEHQAALLRRLARGERLNEMVDWSNVIEEVEDVGPSELRAWSGSLATAHPTGTARTSAARTDARFRGALAGMTKRESMIRRVGITRFIVSVTACFHIMYYGLVAWPANALAQAALPTALYPVGMTQVEFVDPADGGRPLGRR